MRRLALALLLLTANAPAQEVEQVTVYGGNLSGFWHTSSPDWVGVTLFGGLKWGPLRQRYSRISYDKDGYTTHNFLQKGGGGALEVDGTHFHLAWGPMLARLIYDGEVTSATSIRGHFAIKLMGIPNTDTDVSEGTKLEIKPGMPDPAGKENLLRTLLGSEAVAHDPTLDASIAEAQALKLGKIEAIAYLGQQPQPNKEGPKFTPDLNYLSAYAVEFAEGERICWLHQDDDGKLAAFQCS